MKNGASSSPRTRFLIPCLIVEQDNGAGFPTHIRKPLVQRGYFVLYSRGRPRTCDLRVMRTPRPGTGDIPQEISRFFDLLQQHYAPRFGSPKLLTDAEISGIACPVLLMSGSGDAFFNAEKTVKQLKKLLPGAEIHVSPKGKHGITDYGGRIMEFLAGK
jgi:pimeloyl-ACP methyl ester carboxylesterase